MTHAEVAAGNSLTYRADIDGLRAIAVLPVVAFHASLIGFSGGFVGVDIFFVISGYLITNILLNDLKSGRLHIGTFYLRRIRRIFPALFFAILMTIILGALLLTPEDYTNLGESILATCSFVSNFYFWRSVDYFSDAASVPPLLHTWSLSVEEQFYIFYPVFLWALSKTKVRPVAAILVVAGVSLTAAATLVFFKQSATFFLLPFRAWELMAGGLVATLPSWRAVRGSKVTRSIDWAAILLIVVPVVSYGQAMAFPGLAALPPVLGAALLIANGASSGTLVRSFLTTPWMVSIGRASYSLYLLHFPLLAMIRYTGNAHNIIAVSAACAASILLAFVSLHFIERPFRHSRGGWRSPGIIYAIASIGAVASIGAAIYLTGGLPARLSKERQAIADVQYDKGRQHLECMSLDQTIVNPDRACLLGDKTSVPRVILWGDSHAVITATAMEAAAKRAGRSFLFAATADCPTGIGFDISPDTDRQLSRMPSYRYCGRYNSAMFAQILRSPNIKTVVISNRWSNWRLGSAPNPAEARADLRLRDNVHTAGSVAENPSIFAKGFIDLVDKLTHAGKRVIIVGPLPEPSFNVPHTLFVQPFKLDKVPPYVSTVSFMERNALIFSIFRTVGQRDRVSFLWPHTKICNALLCPVAEGVHPLYFDHDHLSIYGALKTQGLYSAIFS